MILSRLLGRAAPPAPVARVAGEPGFIVQPPATEGRPPPRLTMPGPLSPPTDGAFAVSTRLHWRGGLAPTLIGRDSELSGLLGWAKSGRRVRLRVMSGPAGIGKSRLAAALAAALPDWQCGIVPLGTGASLPLEGAGLLLVIERPEAAPEAFRTLLRAAARVETVALPVRLLVLSRRPANAWRQDISECDAAELCGAPDLALGPLTPPMATALFTSVTGDPDTAGFTAWHGRRPASHGVPLMVLAAAIARGDGFDLNDPELDVLGELARRERDALDRAASGRGWTGRGASRLAGLAQLRDGIDPPCIRRLAAPALGVEMPPVESAVASVAALGWFGQDGAPEPPPDLFAAALLRDVLNEAGPRAPDWVWATLGDRGVLKPELVARRADDWAASQADGEAPGLAAVVANAVGGRAERADRWRGLLEAPEGERRLALVAAAVGRGLLAQPRLPDANRAIILNGIADRLWDGGDKQGAVVALREAADVRRHLARGNPGRFDTPLALTLASLSNRLGETGDAAAAVAAIEEAVALRRQQAGNDPARFEPQLAHCLGLLSSRLTEAGDGPAALAAIEEATALRRRLAEADPAKWEHDLSASLNLLSIRRSDLGDRPGAMQATREGVTLRRRLARADPARHEPGLAQSLHNLAIRLVEVDDPAGALAAAQEAVSIRRRLAQAAPARFERDLTQSLQNLSHRLAENADPGAALAAIRECVVIRRRLAQTAPERFNGDLAEALTTLSQRLVESGELAAALPSIREATELRRRLADASPARFEPVLALSLHLLGLRLFAVDDRAAARRAVTEAIAIRERLSAADANRHGAGLAASRDLLAELSGAELTAP
jgi:hypothetical protein